MKLRHRPLLVASGYFLQPTVKTNHLGLIITTALILWDNRLPQKSLENILHLLTIPTTVSCAERELFNTY